MNLFKNKPKDQPLLGSVADYLDHARMSLKTKLSTLIASQHTPAMTARAKTLASLCDLIGERTRQNFDSIKRKHHQKSLGDGLHRIAYSTHTKGFVQSTALSYQDICKAAQAHGWHPKSSSSKSRPIALKLIQGVLHDLEKLGVLTLAQANGYADDHGKAYPWLRADDTIAFYVDLGHKSLPMGAFAEPVKPVESKPQPQAQVIAEPKHVSKEAQPRAVVKGWPKLSPMAKRHTESPAVQAYLGSIEVASLSDEERHTLASMNQWKERLDEAGFKLLDTPQSASFIRQLALKAKDAVNRALESFLKVFKASPSSLLVGRLYQTLKLSERYQEQSLVRQAAKNAQNTLKPSSSTPSGMLPRMAYL